MDKNNLYLKMDELLIMEKGIYNDKIMIFLKNDYFHVQESYVRCFKFSIKRAKNTLNIKDTTHLFNIFIKNINNINLEKKNENLYYLNISDSGSKFGSRDYFAIQTYKIKLKEINNFLYISNIDNHDIIIKKQNEKIISLLSKIDEFEKKFKEPTTDDELIITIK